MKINKVFISAALIVAPLYMPQLVIAEESVNTMEEVIVTSRRKNESVQDVPLSVTVFGEEQINQLKPCLLYTSPSPRDQRGSRMPSSA